MVFRVAKQGTCFAIAAFGMECFRHSGKLRIGQRPVTSVQFIKEQPLLCMIFAQRGCCPSPSIQFAVKKH